MRAENAVESAVPNMLRRSYYMVMPCFGVGRDLFDYVDDAPEGLPAAEVRSIYGQIADALAFLHGNGIVHRDIKDECVRFTCQLKYSLIAKPEGTSSWTARAMFSSSTLVRPPTSVRAANSTPSPARSSELRHICGFVHLLISCATPQLRRS